ncbi:unnamed protein product [Calypogeia fissa]
MKKMAKVAKPPLYMISLFPLFCIAAFSLFVVWQWWAQLALNSKPFPDPGDKVAFLSTVTISKTNPDTSSDHVLADLDILIGTEDSDPAFVRGEVRRCCECGIHNEVKPVQRASLLHNWTDQELYSRVIGAELKQRTKNTPTGKEVDCSTIDDGWSGRSTRHQLRSGSTESCTTFCARNNDSGSIPDGAVPGGKVKIAFLVMITTSLPFEPLWNKFFEGKEGLYNVYVHADPFNPNLFSKSSKIFYNRLIPSQKAYRGSPSLVMASNRLVANAMLDDPANAYFVLLSGQCIPIRSFDHAYQVISSSKRSFLEQIVNETVMVERYSGQDGGMEVMLPEITFDQFRKSSQWFVYLRRHALMILQDVHKQKYWSHFDHPCVIYFCGTDEHYYPTFFNIVDPDGVTGTCLTYVEWPDYVSEHPVTFYRDNISKDLITSIQTKNDGQYLFARKMEIDTVDLLMNLTDTILR